ncbi:DUF4388 domain-containing protein [Chloracidobacterium aggregatum]|uniref:DUF4388 domain-containing protein n=1 Tax=Chloracidobacterium aggregatum TaxID=2851959 RepID=UPI001B8D6532|nr:DUF4388 domain-containing protein [Chloracidobacterium aggregatum]QUV86098.1 DUF4388 domain-containing protein [Chloracidobacterium sp. 2]QUV89455.1 DUF4388 domain-containing protein [Chloracidobacterium sp. S]QUV92542.1 DUF4388 domain-containing protein [Chloracidobacterium sp. A]QUV98222.1 DUF4388 domain-containing protein [Chloracidobacterium sp. E]
MATFGSLSDLDLLTLTQILCRAGRLAALELVQDEQCGWIYFENGRVVHAMLDTLAGEPALLALLRWKSGRFRVIPGFYAPDQTLELSWPELTVLVLNLPSGKWHVP